MMVLNKFKQVLKDISSLKIQGATSVARESVKALRTVLKNSKSKTVNSLIKDLVSARNMLVNTRPTEPEMRNALSYALHDLDYNNIIALRQSALGNIEKVLRHFREVNRLIAEIGEHRIKNGMVVYTHCHSSNVITILRHAHNKGKIFEVHNTETRPLYQGRKTAKELSKIGIKVRHYVDSAARLALKKADIMLIGADAITSEGKVINKVGSELFAESAAKMDVPLYVCTDSWKFDSETIFGFDEPIEKRDIKEVWKNPPKNVTIDNFAFEIIDHSLIKGVITELGVYRPEVLVEIIFEKYPWMRVH